VESGLPIYTRTLVTATLLCLAACSGLAQTLSVTPNSGLQNATTFNYSGTGYTPNGTIRRFLTFPNGNTQEISAISANSSGQAAIAYRSVCSDAVGNYQARWRDATTGRESQVVTTTITFNPACSPLTLVVSPSSGQQNLTTFSYSGSGFTPNGLVRRFLTFPNGTSQEISSITANSSGQASAQYQSNCSDLVGTYAARWLDASTGRETQTVTTTIVGNPACAAVTLSVNPISGQQNSVVFSYSGSNYTPNGVVRRFLTYPSGLTQEISSITANAQGQASAIFSSTCSDAVGTYSVRWRDNATGRESQAISATITANPACSPVSLSVAPTSGQQNVAVFNYSGSNYTRNGVVRRFLTFPNGTTQEISSITSNASGQASASFTSTCADAVGSYAVRWRDASTGRESQSVTVTITSNPACSPVTLTVSLQYRTKNEFGKSRSENLT
jgi:hypothetical protein